MKKEKTAKNKIAPIAENQNHESEKVPRKSVFHIDSFVDKLVGKDDDIYNRMLLEYDTFKNPPSLIAANIHSVTLKLFFKFFREQVFAELKIPEISRTMQS